MAEVRRRAGERAFTETPLASCIPPGQLTGGLPMNMASLLSRI